MRCEEYRAAHLAGELGQEHLAHRASCSDCEVAEASLDEMAAMLAAPDVWDEPDPALAELVVATIVGASGPAWPRRSGWWKAAAVAVLALLVGAAAWWSLRPAPPDWEAALVGVGERPQAAASVLGWNRPAGSRMVMEVEGLGPAPAGSFYELWLSSEEGWVSAGSFTDDGRIEVFVGVARRDFPRLWVTVEAADGDPTPTRQAVLDTPGW